MRILWLWTPPIVWVQAVGDKNPDPKNRKKQKAVNPESEAWQNSTHQNYLPNELLDVATVIAVSNHKIAESIEAALQSYEDMKNK